MPAVGCEPAGRLAAVTALAVHGGAGVIQRIARDRRARAEVVRALGRALDAGWDALAAGANALDAVVAAVVVLEDSPHFNAGRGAALAADGTAELDAAVMDGSTRAAGAVTLVRTVRNPVLLARAVLEHTPHVLLAGEAADDLADDVGLERVPNSWFVTDRRRRQLEQVQSVLGPGVPAPPSGTGGHGTVGAVALDAHGRLATATSTGGLTNQRVGRVGDTPLVGAGTYADDLVAVSCTGRGEAFVRTVAAHALAARIRFAGVDLDQAAAATLADVQAVGGGGGLVAVDHRGRLALPFTTPGMYRAWRTHTDGPHVAIT